MAIFTNQAVLTYNGTSTSSNITTGEIVEVLSATKTALVNTYTADRSITYIISIVNSGNTAYTGLTLTDNLGAYNYNTTTLYPLTYIADSVKYYVNGVLQASPAVTAGPPLTVTGISVPANGNATVIYETAVNRFAPLSAVGSITNTATVTSDTLTTPVVDSETITTVTAPNLSITKSLSPATVTENSQITYTFVIQNYGNTAAAATDNLVVTDTFDPVLSNITVTFNGTVWSNPVNYTYSELTGLFATVGGQLTVPAATYTQDAVTGVWTVNPGVSTLTVTGTI